VSKTQLHKRIEIVEGNIIHQRTEAIVNAANESLLGGGGVDGAIHRAAGPHLVEECKKLKGCPTGQAKITRGHNLHAKYVIHAVGPIWRSGKNNEDELLAGCYRNALALAAEHKIRSVSFPSISTGVYRFPMERAAKIALTETKKFLDKNESIEKVVFVCFGHDAWALYLQTARDVFPGFQG
jgi:O-acetyl-ADP-ribose deacetylase